jgi:20S proteasome subunit alpha 7
MLVSGSNRRIFGVDSHVGIAITGNSADGRQIVNRAREEAVSYNETYGSKVVPSVLSNRVALYMHYFTTHGSLRPFGAAALIAAFDEDLNVPELYMAEPSGLCLRYFGCAAGKGASAARTELEKILSRKGELGISCREAVVELAKILYTIRDPSKDKPFELEMSWLCSETRFQHSLVPADLLQSADLAAKSLGDSNAGGTAGGGGGV